MRLASAILVLLYTALLLLAPAAEAQVAIANEKVALTGEADPFGGLLPADLKVFRLGDDGAMLFHSMFFRPDGLATTRLYSGTYAGAVKRLADGAHTTGNRPVTDFLFSASNDSGQIALTGYDGGLRNVYLLTGTTLKTIAVEQAPAAGDGTFSSLYDPALDTAGHLVFKADTTQSGMGLFFVDGMAATPVVKQIAVADGVPPEGGTFTYFDSRPSIVTRSDGKIVVFFNAATTDGAGADGAGFYAAIVGDTGPAVISKVAPGLHLEFAANRLGQVVYHDFSTLYVGDLSGSTMIAQQGDPAPGGDTFASFGDVAINDAGTVVFQATTGSSLAGLYVSTAAGITRLAIQNMILGDDLFQEFGTPQLNQNGLIAFAADVAHFGAPATSIYLSDGTGLVRVISNGDSLAGSAVEAGTVDQSLVLAPSSLNLHGQIAFSAILTNGKAGLFIATPTSHLRDTGPGLWDNPLTWDYRIVPGPDTPVIANSAVDVVLQGPPAAARKVRSLMLGGGTKTTTLRLQSGSTLTVPKGVTLLNAGVLTGSATIAGNLTMSAGSELQLDLAGATRADYEFLRVTGTATLGGTLAVNKTNSFEPTRGQTFDLLDLTKRIGTFATVTPPALNPAGQTWDVTRLYTTGVIAVSGATLFAPVAGVFTGTFEGNPTAANTSGSLVLTLAPNGTLRGSIVYAGRPYVVNTLLAVDGSATVSIGLPKKTLQIQVATVNQAPQLTAMVSTGGVLESQSTSARANPAFPVSSPLVGHYTIALPPDQAHPEATFPQGTGYAKVTVTTHGLATVVGVLGDGTPFSAGGPVTAAGEFPFYVAAYAAKGVVAGKLVLHSSAPTDSVEGSFRWLKPATPTGKFQSAIDATVTIFGSGYQSPVAPAKILTFANDTATFHAVGGNVDPLADKTVLLGTAYAFKSTTSEPFAFTFSAATYGLGSGSFRDANNKVRTMKGVALQKQNEVVGLLIGTDQNGAFDID